MSSLCLELWAAVITQINPLGLATVEKESSEEQMAMRACESFLRGSWGKEAARHGRPQPIVLKLAPARSRREKHIPRFTWSGGWGSGTSIGSSAPLPRRW